MIFASEIDSIINPAPHLPPMPSSMINAVVEHYRIGKYHQAVTQQQRREFELWLAEHETHPLTPEQSIPTAHQCAIQMDLLMHPPQEQTNG